MSMHARTSVLLALKDVLSRVLNILRVSFRLRDEDEDEDEESADLDDIVDGVVRRHLRMAYSFHRRKFERFCSRPRSVLDCSSRA